MKFPLILCYWSGNSTTKFTYSLFCHSSPSFILSDFVCEMGPFEGSLLVLYSRSLSQFSTSFGLQRKEELGKIHYSFTYWKILFITLQMFLVQNRLLKVEGNFRSNNFFGAIVVRSIFTHSYVYKSSENFNKRIYSGWLELHRYPQRKANKW